MRSLTVFLLAALFATAAGAIEPKICASRFALTHKQACSGYLAVELIELHDVLVEAYNSKDKVLNIPISQQGSVYLRSTCDHLTALLPRIGASIVREDISEDDYTRVVEEARGNRFWPLECDR